MEKMLTFIILENEPVQKRKIHGIFCLVQSTNGKWQQLKTKIFN